MSDDFAKIWAAAAKAARKFKDGAPSPYRSDAAPNCASLADCIERNPRTFLQVQDGRLVEVEQWASLSFPADDLGRPVEP